MLRRRRLVAAIGKPNPISISILKPNPATIRTGRASVGATAAAAAAVIVTRL